MARPDGPWTGGTVVVSDPTPPHLPVIVLRNGVLTRIPIYTLKDIS